MKLSRRRFVRTGGAAAVVATAGCDPVLKGLFSFLPPSADPGGPFEPPAAESIDLVSHVLNRFAFGPRPGDYERVRKMGPSPEEAVRIWLDGQLNPEGLEDAAAEYAVRRFETLGQPAGELFEYKEDILLEHLTRATLLRAVLSTRQLYEVMVQFWTDHFNIDPSKGDCKWLKAADDREVIRRHALGRFPAMLRASALSPAMLWYLDGRVNRKERPADRPNENYARELMELHTLGVHGGYSQKDVMEVARCLTGWTVRSNESLFQIGRVEFKDHLHDNGPKEVLGRSIPAGLGRGDLDRVLDIVALHPSTAQHLAMKLCRRFIADDPPEAAIGAVADAFLTSRGDVRESLLALFAREEFHASRGSKFKRPFNFIASALRATGAKSDAAPPLIDFLVRMGHAPFQYPTPDGYPEEAQPWMGTLLWRWHFAVALSRNKIKGTHVDFERLKRRLGRDEDLMAHFLGRRPTELEMEAYRASGEGLALMLASPAFQRC